MTDASQLPKLPWWVRWWTDNETTPTSFRRAARFDFLLAVGLLVCFALVTLFGHFQFLWLGVLLPAASAAAGIWKLAVIAWLDRHQAWDRLIVRPRNQVAPIQPVSPVHWGRITLALIVLSVLLAISGWRFWICFVAPDDSLWNWGESSRVLNAEKLRLTQEHYDNLKAMRKAPERDREEESLRYEEAVKQLEENEMHADAPRRRWFEFGLGSIALFMALFIGWGAYKGWREAEKGRAA